MAGDLGDDPDKGRREPAKPGDPGGPFIEKDDEAYRASRFLEEAATGTTLRLDEILLYLVKQIESGTHPSTSSRVQYYSLLP